MLTVFNEDIEAADRAIGELHNVAVSMRGALASAIAEQREKSAKIAESFTRERGAVAKEIAAAIRKNLFNV